MMARIKLTLVMISMVLWLGHIWYMPIQLQYVVYELQQQTDENEKQDAYKYSVF